MNRNRSQEPEYNELARRMADEESVIFFNHGYASSPADFSEPLPDYYQSYWPNQAALYLHLFELADELIGDLSSSVLLEVGCGRGGGLSLIHELKSPAASVGVELAKENVSFCQTRWGKEGLTFVEGRAEDLPCGDDSCNLVLNVESFHAYGDPSAFLKEVERVLRPGGLLLLADCAPRSELLFGAFDGGGLSLQKMGEITERVAIACGEDKHRLAKLPVRDLSTARYIANISAEKEQIYKSRSDRYYSAVFSMPD